MMGEWLLDEYAIESSHRGRIRGMGLFPVETEFEEEKVRTQTEGRFGELYGCFRELSGKKLTGYEIHMGRTRSREKEQPLCLLNTGENINGQRSQMHSLRLEPEKSLWFLCSWQFLMRGYL